MLNEEFWARYFQVYDRLNLLIPYQNLMEELERELSIRSEDVILDVGSGTGNLMVRLKNKCRQIIGIDYSAEGIKAHKQKDSNADVRILDISERFPFENDYFSKVVSNNVIYTLTSQNQEKTLNEMYRVLKPGGKIVISNIKKDFSPLHMYIVHLLKSVKEKGFLHTIISFFSLMVSNLKILYFNKKIKESGLEDSYHFLSMSEQGALLQKIGFKNVSGGKLVYASQAYLHSAYK